MYVEPGHYWNGWNQSSWPTQPPTHSGMRIDYWPKCDVAMWLESKGGYMAHSTCGFNVSVAKTVIIRKHVPYLSALSSVLTAAVDDRQRLTLNVDGCRRPQ